MKFVFWQNVISIHQSAFIKALAENHDVTLVAQESLDRQRREEKWSVPEMGNAKVIVAPDADTIPDLLSLDGAEHVFSGIDAYPMVYSVLKSAVSRGLKITILAEPYEWAGLKGFMRRIKYMLLSKKYGKYIKHLFTTGNKGVECYRNSLFDPNIIHQWGYFTEQNNCSKTVSTADKVRLLYVGRLDSNKNIIPILKHIDKYGSYIERFTVVGDGDLMNELRAIAESNNKIKVLGRLDNSEAVEQMAVHDYLILPSLYDGWGAVVNEALAHGTRVLCSDACGASILLDGKQRGESFKQSEAIDTIQRWVKNGPVSVDEKNLVKEWAKTHISGGVAAEYFVKIIEGNNINAPWID